MNDEGSTTETRPAAQQAGTKHKKETEAEIGVISLFAVIVVVIILLTVL